VVENSEQRFVIAMTIGPVQTRLLVGAGRTMSLLEARKGVS